MLRRQWFLAMLVCVVPVGFAFPKGGEWLRETSWATPALVAVTLLISGLGLDTGRLARQTTNVRGIVLTLLSTYCAAPLLAYGLTTIAFPTDAAIDTQLREAMMLMAAQAGTLASALALTLVARGDSALALVLTIASNVLTVIFTPLVLKLTIGVTVEFDVQEMMHRMALAVLAPVVAGQILRRLLGKKLTVVLPKVRLVPQLIILVFVYTGVAAAADPLRAAPDVAVRCLVVCATLHAALLGCTFAGARLLRLSSPARTAVIFCGSQKTLPNGIYLWERFFGDNPYGAVPLVIYHLFQLVVDAFLATRIGRSNEPSPDE